MNLGYLTLRRLCDELRENWVDLKIRSAGITSSADLYLVGDNNRALFLSAWGPQARIVDVQGPPPEDLATPPWVTRHIVGAAVRDIRLVPYERIIEIDLMLRDRLGGQGRTTFIAELIGWRSNLFFVSSENRKIVANLRHYSGSKHRTDQRSPGQVYSPPPAPGRTAPPDLTVAALQDILAKEGDAATNLTRAVSGLDPLSSRELLTATGIGASPDADSLQALLDAIRRLFYNPPWSRRAAVVSVTGAGLKNADEISVIELRHVDASDRTEFDTVSAAIAELVCRDQSRSEVRGEGKSIRRTLEKLITAADRKIERIGKDMEDAEQADQLEKFGNLLMASLDTVPRGAGSISLPDLFDPDGPDVDIRLDPERSAVDIAADYLKRSKKGRRGGPIAQRRMDKAKKDRAEVSEAMVELDKADPDTLEELRGGWVERGWLRPGQGNRPQQRRRAPGDINPRRYRTSDGWTVLVGRNNKENDRLTRGSAKEDLFFHAQGCPGSHVILKQEGKPGEPGKAALQEAAGLAAYWSKARGAKTVPVNYTACRHVTKPRGAADGLVTIRNEKTIFASPKEIPRADEA